MPDHIFKLQLRKPSARVSGERDGVFCLSKVKDLEQLKSGDEEQLWKYFLNE